MVGEQKLNNLRKALGVESQNAKSKLARASWKYHFFRKSEIEQYCEYLIDNVRPEIYYPKRHDTITKLNYFVIRKIYTGKWLVERNFTKYHTSFKVGQFTKNRKPYYFRSKKKKNVTKKNTLPQLLTVST